MNEPSPSDGRMEYVSTQSDLHLRLDAQAQVIEGLAQRLNTLETWVINQRPQTLGAGIGQPIPKTRYTTAERDILKAMKESK